MPGAIDTMAQMVKKKSAAIAKITRIARILQCTYIASLLSNSTR